MQSKGNGLLAYDPVWRSQGDATPDKRGVLRECGADDQGLLTHGAGDAVPGGDGHSVPGGAAGKFKKF